MHGLDGAAANDASAKRVSREASSQRWTREDRNRFFDHFAVSGDAARAAEAVGKTARSAFALRRRSADFAATWRAVMDDTYERLEAAIVRQVLGDGASKVDIAAALLLLERRPGAAAGGPVAKRRGADGVNPRVRAERELLRKLRAHARRSGGPVEV